jgi:hypothetical protein
MRHRGRFAVLTRLDSRSPLPWRSYKAAARRYGSCVGPGAVAWLKAVAALDPDEMAGRREGPCT